MEAFFTSAEVSILLRLLIAHCLADFFFQPNHWVADKKNRVWRSKFLWYHGLVIALVTWLLAWDASWWWPVAAITATHLIIDGFKLSLGNKSGRITTEFRLFVADQALHVIIIIIVWLSMNQRWDSMNRLLAQILPDHRILLRILGYLLMTGPVGFLIQFLTRRWAAEINTEDSLKDAGRWIGILERVLILTLVYIHEFGAIGFLITAKSLLRVIDKPFAPGSEPTLMKPFSPRKHTEYVLIGTFLSFAIAILTGLLINRLLV